MALTNLQDHPFARTDVGQIGQGTVVYKAKINGTDVKGFFIPLEGGLNISYNTDQQEFMVAGRVRNVSYQNPKMTATLDCIYAFGGPGAPATEQESEMDEALGLGSGTGSFRWRFRPGDKWEFRIDTDNTDRVYQSTDEPFPDFLNETLFIESGSAFSIPNTDRWNLNLSFMRYLNSAVMQSVKLSTLTGERIT